MWWKIYFWILLALTLIGSIILAKDISNFNLGDWLGIISNILILLAVYSLTFKKTVFSKKWWKVILWIMLLNMIVELEPTGILKKSLNFLQPQVLQVSTSEVIFQFIVAIPAFYAMYKLGYK